MRLLILLSNVILTSTSGLKEMTTKRDKLFNKELENMLGNDILLNEKELKVNKIFMGLKTDHLKRGFKNPKDFIFYDHFFGWRDRVNGCKLFKLIKMMPKGAILHAHDTGILSADYMLTLTYWDNLYVRMNNGKAEEFKFSKTDPAKDVPKKDDENKDDEDKDDAKKHDAKKDDAKKDDKDKPPKSKCPCEDGKGGGGAGGWKLMKDARNASGDVTKFDAELKKGFGMVCKNPAAAYPDITAAWFTFQNIFIHTGNLVTYKPAWEKYFYDTLKALKDDGVMYLEVRSVLPPLYDLDGKTGDAIETAVTYKKVVDQFKNDFPDFFDAKLIYAPLRKATPDTVEEYIKTARKIKQRLPDFIVGFDLVGQEDLGEPLNAFVPQLLNAKGEFNLFLHAGETNWNGLSTDENLYDAITLGAKRIGHAYSIVKHPVLMEEVKKRNIGIEVNVLSNVVLKLVKDVRNHPLATWLVSDMPVFLSSDDPGLWGADPMSHDYYYVFVGVSNARADLRMLKKLALNSLAYSAYPRKEEMVKHFESRWTKFINSVICGKPCCGS